MATAPSTNASTELVSGADIVIQSVVNHDLKGVGSIRGSPQDRFVLIGDAVVVTIGRAAVLVGIFVRDAGHVGTGVLRVDDAIAIGIGPARFLQ